MTTPATRLLAVDDEPHLLRALVLNFAARGYEVDTAATGEAALIHVRQFRPEIVILDLGLPDIDGLDVIRNLQEHDPEVPVIVLSARHSSHEKVTALDLGALDYITKPFDMNELIARVRTVVRRGIASSAPRRLTIGSVDLDLGARSARSADGLDVHLTPTEWCILAVLLSRPGRLVTSRELLTAVRGDPDHTEGSYLRIYLAQLRRKLEPTPSRPRYLLTEPGMGYRFTP